MKADAGRPEEDSRSLRAGVTVKRCLMWVLGIELTSSAQAE